jgi:hypothetical protein
MEQTLELIRKDTCRRMLAKWKADKAKIKEEVIAFYGMRERGDAEGKAYMEKMSAKWKAKREKKKKLPTSRG